MQLCVCTQESDLIENVEEDKDSDTAKMCEEEKSKVQVMYCSGYVQWLIKQN